jgi:hypothetical protein
MPFRQEHFGSYHFLILGEFQNAISEIETPAARLSFPHTLCG